MEKLITERLELRRFTQTDEGGFVEILTDPEVYKFLGDGQGATPEFAKKILVNYIFNRGIFAVVEKTANTLVGYCGVRPIQDGRIELLYGYGPAAWGKGFGTEAAKAVLQYAKDELLMKNIIAIAYPENLGSIGVIKKLNFTHCGTEEHFGKMLELFSLSLND